MSNSRDQVILAASDDTDIQPNASSHLLPKQNSEPRVGHLDQQMGGLLGYFKTKEFYITLVLGQLLAIANTSTGTFTTLLGLQKWAIPAFQTWMNYALLSLIFTPYTIYRYGIKGWLRLVVCDGWKYFILAFCDVEGNYFIVLAYQYTTMLSAQLINFWAIVVVVGISFIFLRVRYQITQIMGIMICVSGMCLLISSDHIRGVNGGSGNISPSHHQLKGDLFALLGATFYGLTNTAEEYFVSTRPVYEVLGQLSLFGMCINGVQVAIFERDKFPTSHWNGTVGAYLVGYTLCLSFFYCLAPLLFRLSSAAFFNISLLTMNFWSVCIGIVVFHYHIHWMYPIAFCLIIIGQLIYYLGHQVVLGDARKPWLGLNQEGGVAGLFTAKRRMEHVAGSVAATSSSSHHHHHYHDSQAHLSSNMSTV